MKRGLKSISRKRPAAALRKKPASGSAEDGVDGSNIVPPIEATSIEEPPDECRLTRATPMAVPSIPEIGLEQMWHEHASDLGDRYPLLLDKRYRVGPDGTLDQNWEAEAANQ